MSENAVETSFTPPYIAFKTITTLLERMQREEPPSRIDKSYLDNFSGGYQTQVLAALHSLELLGPNGELSDTLKALVKAGQAEQKQIVGGMIRHFYAPVLALGTNSTQAQLLEGFSDLAPKVTGDTKRKAIAFLLGACQFAGLPVSRYWKTPRVPPSGRKRELAGKASDQRDTESEREPDEPRTDAPPANQRALQLRSGGVITLGLSVDLFSLTGGDREFVFDLIDKMTAYENQRALPAATTPSNGLADPDLERLLNEEEELAAEHQGDDS